MLNLPEKITGNRIYLQRHDKTLAHAMEMHKLVRSSIRELQPWLSWAIDIYSLEEAYEYIVYSHSLWREGSGYVFAIFQNDGKCIGNISILNIDYKNQHSEIGYWLATEVAGNGYMQEAVSILEKEVFAAGMHKIIIKTDVLNVKSANVAQKQGYVLDGIMRGDMYAEQEGRFRDINIFSKIKEG